MRYAASASSGRWLQAAPRRSGAAPAPATRAAPAARPRARRRGSAGSGGSARGGCGRSPRWRRLPGRRPGARELGEVGEQAEGLELAGQEVRVVGRQRGAHLLEAGDQHAGLGGAHVVAEQQGADLAEDRGAPARGGRRPPPASATSKATRGRAGAAATGGRDGASTRSSGAPASTWTLPATRTSVTTPSNGAATVVSIFMLSSTTTGAPAATYVADRGCHRDHERRAPAPARGRPRRATRGGRRRRPRAGGPAGGLTAMTRCSRPLTQSRDSKRPRRSTRTSSDALGDGHPVAARARPRDGQAVRLAAMAQLHRAPDLVARLRPAAARGGVEAPALDGLLGGIGVDRGRDDRDVRVAVREQRPLGGEAVEPPGVGSAVHHLRPPEQVEQEGAVRRPAAHDDAHLLERPAQAGERLGAVGAPRDDLRDHRVVLGRDRVPLGDPRVNADPRPGRQAQELHQCPGRARSRARRPRR